MTEPNTAEQTSAPDEPEKDAAPLAAHAHVREDSPAFSDFAVRPEIVEALTQRGITRTFAIQELTLPIALAGNDLIGQARTGTGKTLGFGVPLLNRLELPSAPGAAPQALVVAPTRELAVQVAGDLKAAGSRLSARGVVIYGGRAYEPQIEALKKGTDVVVGTPGRLLDLAQQGHLRLSGIRILVLDEADEMLDLGFLPDIEKLLGLLPGDRQTMLFSATMPGPIVSLARKFLNQPIQIRAEHGDESPATEHVDQYAYRAHQLDKPELVARILQAKDRGLTMIFTRTKRSADRLGEDLAGRGFAAASVHGDLGQAARERSLRAFRSGKVDVLVATDVAARGLDVEGVTHVINYECPDDSNTYVHRIGRTARAGASGTGITLIDWEDMTRWKQICDTLSLPFHEPAETYSTSEHLYLELDIPPDAGATLPRAERTRAGLEAEALEDLGERRREARPQRGERPARPRRDRARRRTRGGQQVDAEGGAPSSDAAEPRESETPESGPSESGASKSGASQSRDSGDRPRRRRRRRGSPSAGSDTTGADSASTSGPGATPAAGEAPTSGGTSADGGTSVEGGTSATPSG